MDIETRIAQFENMCKEDPENDMAHFSLGNAYRQAGRHADAAGSYIRCTELNPSMSKAYQLAGEALVDAGDSENAARVLTEGFVAAAERGDLMPKNAMEALLKRIGAPVPEVEVKKEARIPEGSFVCSQTGKPGTKLPRAPFRGPIGAWIQENISKETFDDWIRQGTKVINELRLDLSRDEDEVVYDAHMREYLGITDDLYQKLTGAAPPKSRV